MTVTTIRVRESFPFVSATMPSTRTWEAGRCPFGVMLNNQLEPCQWEYAGVGLVELIFPSVGPGTYEIYAQESRDQDCKPGRWAAQFVEDAPRFLLGGGLELCQFDKRPFRNGRYCRTRRFFSEHVVGWVTVYAGIDVVRLDFKLVDGLPGSADLFFDSLVYIGPPAEAIVHGIPQPQAFGNTLVPQRADGKLHALERKGKGEFRMVLAYSDAALATALAQRHDFGLSDLWTRQPGLQPHEIPMPDLRAREADLLAECRGELKRMQDAVANGWLVGAGAPGTPTKGGRMDWKSIWGDWNGATTGGSFRRQWEGYYAVASGHPDAVRELELRNALISNRMACAILKPNGMPVEMQDWLDPQGKPLGGWDVSNAGLWFERSGALEDQKDGAFGFSRAVNDIEPALVPPELALMSTFATGGVNLIDNDHFDRACQPALALAVLTNDPLARWDVRVYQSVLEMQIRTSGFHAEAGKVTASPGHGTTWGRNPAHMMAFAAGAYRLSPARIRARWEPLFDEWVMAVGAAQAASGIIGIRDRKEAHAPPFDGTHALAKGTEEALLVGSLMAVQGTGALDVGASAVAVAGIMDWVRKGLIGFLWRSGGSPVNFAAARPMPYAAVPYQSYPVASGFDSEEIGAALGYALWLDPEDPVVMAAVRKYCGGAADPLAWLRTRPTGQLMLDDRCPLVAALERV